MAPWGFAAAYAVFDRLQPIGADMADRGQPRRTWITEECGWLLEIVERPRRGGWYPVDVEPPPMPAFPVLPRRWVVERTLAWMGR
jgi:transposase